MPIFIKDRSICITGTLATMTRIDAETSVLSRGGIVDKTVKYNTNYLVVGEKAGNTKVKAGKLFKIPILSETDFLSMLQSNPILHTQKTKPIDPTDPIFAEDFKVDNSVNVEKVKTIKVKNTPVLIDDFSFNSRDW